MLAIPERLAPVSPFFDERADACEAGFVVGLAEIDRAADGGVHGGAAQFFGGNFLPDGGLHQRGAGEEKAAAVGHEDVIAHHRKISAAGHAHAHDGGDLRDAHGRHDRVVAKDAAEIVGIGENVFLQREEDSGGIDQVDRRDAIFDGDVLRADDFLRGHGEEGAGFDGGVVDDEHDQAGVDASESGDHAGGRRASPFFVHFVRGIEAEFEERAGIGEQVDALAGGEA